MGHHWKCGLIALAVSTVSVLSSVALADEEPLLRGTGVLESDSGIAPEIRALIMQTKGMVSPYDHPKAAEGESSNSVKYGIKGEDTRKRVLDTRGFPASAVVQIFIRSSKGRCSGAMIAPDTVLTAAHCLHGGTDKGTWFSEVFIVPGRNKRATPYGFCRMKRAHVLEEWTTLETPIDIRDFDLGIIKLDCDVGIRTDWFDIAEDDEVDEERASIVHGYTSSRAPFGSQWTSVDAVGAVSPLKAFYKNDTYRGTSGAPVYSDASEPKIFCVHTNGFNEQLDTPWNEYNACTRLTPENRETVAGWMALDDADCAAESTCNEEKER